MLVLSYDCVVEINKNIFMKICYEKYNDIDII
jgi:hypothetical protein